MRADPGAYWSLPAEALLDQLKSTTAGLKTAEAAARIAQYGPNTLDATKQVGAVGLLARQFRSPLVLILIGASLVSLVAGEWVDAGVVLAEDSGRGWRRVVASPRPAGIVERDSIVNLLDHEFIVIACGGGGIPVVRDAAGDLHGVAAVVDKDFASACLADVVGADHLFILTAVDHVAVGFGTPRQRDLHAINAAAARQHLADGEFGAGSMQPKVEAALEFVEARPGRTAVICSLDKAPAAMRGESGTRIHC